MTSISPLANVLTKGLYGDYENKSKDKLIKIKEIKNLLIVQIVQYKISNTDIKKLKIDKLNLPEKLKTKFNNQTRILWIGPRNWLLVSEKKALIKEINSLFDDQNFAVTDLSHSRAIIDIEGFLANEVIKKGCPLNINSFKGGDCSNSIFNGVAITIDFLSNNPEKIRLMTLRSFGESLYHSITDASLEFGYEVVL